MKKMKKVLSIACLVCLLIPLLCGCNALDKLRESQAFFDEEGNVLWNGTVYKKLPGNENKYDEFYPEIDYSNCIYVTESDVPVLLVEGMADVVFRVDEAGIILERGYYYSEDGIPYEKAYYCREDKYEEMAPRFLAPFEPEMYCYEYSYYDFDSYEYIDKIYQLSQEEVATLKRIVETVEPTVVGGGWYFEASWSVTIEERTEDMLFQRYYLELAYSEGTYYLEIFDDFGRRVYEVPEADAPTMEKITEQYIVDEGGTYH